MKTSTRNETAKQRLEYLRGELRAERISYGELAELRSLASHIGPEDVELLEAAGVPEFPDHTLIKLACGCAVCKTPYDSHELLFCPTHKAAPELLEACKAALAVLQGYVHGDKPEMCAMAEALEDCHEAIARATGWDTAKVPGVREDSRTGQFVPTINGKDVSPTSFDEARAWEIARQIAAKGEL